MKSSFHKMYFKLFVQLQSCVTKKNKQKTNNKRTKTTTAEKQNLMFGVKSSTELRVENLFILLAHCVLKMC